MHLCALCSWAVSRSFVSWGLLSMLIFVAACSSSRSAVPAENAVDGLLAEDVHSYADPATARVRHVSLDLTADFDARQLRGTATLRVEAHPDAAEIVLDTRKLDVQSVTTSTGEALAYRFGDEDPTLGRALFVTLPAAGNEIVVHYRTAPDADAVQWMTPEQTSSGEHPFLFTQGQAIHTRTWIPTQDSPGIRQTYDAVIHVPEGLTALMSAEMLTPEGEETPGGVAYRFRLSSPIPPYLIALAIGELAFRPLSARTGVWAEPEVVDEASHEFADVPEMLRKSEALFGPYRWERFDVLVLPPSFPYGGMENPRLTFVTPTLLAGDRSLVNVIAHELAHSWSGNLVTNATWDDFWLNEGFTTYLEYRIMEAVYGVPYREMIEQLDRQDLVGVIERAGYDHPDTRLKRDLIGRNPDGSGVSVAYEKGAAFLRAIELEVGRDRFESFLREYFDAHAFRPMTTEHFLAYLDEKLLRDDPETRAAIDPERWVFEPGLPDNAPVPGASAFEAVEGHAASFEAGADPPTEAASAWSTHEWLHFFHSLPDTLTVERMATLDSAFDLTGTRNSEIRFLWLQHAIRAQYEPANAAVEEFLVGQGRLKFVLPLYRELVRSGWGRSRASEIFERARPGYHPITERAVEAIVSV